MNKFADQVKTIYTDLKPCPENYSTNDYSQQSHSKVLQVATNSCFWNKSTIVSQHATPLLMWLAQLFHGSTALNNQFVYNMKKLLKARKRFFKLQTPIWSFLTVTEPQEPHTKKLLIFPQPRSGLSIFYSKDRRSFIIHGNLREI